MNVLVDLDGIERLLGGANDAGEFGGQIERLGRRLQAAQFEFAGIGAHRHAGDGDRASRGRRLDLGDLRGREP